jgi:hypothetical protein
VSQLLELTTGLWTPVLSASGGSRPKAVLARIEIAATKPPVVTYNQLARQARCVGLLCSLSPTDRRSLLWLNTFENERKAGAHIEPATRHHRGRLHLRAVSAGQLLGLFRGDFCIRE